MRKKPKTKTQLNPKNWPNPLPSFSRSAQPKAAQALFPPQPARAPLLPSRPSGPRCSPLPLVPLAALADPWAPPARSVFLARNGRTASP